MYVSLEPCAHEGRTPPCTDAILAAKIARVVVASDDPTPKANGRGLGILRDEGVEVEVVNGDVAAQARLLNQPFRKHALTGRPHVIFKVADHARRQGRHRGRRLEVDLERGEPRAGAPLARRGRRGRRRDPHRDRPTTRSSPRASMPCRSSPRASSSTPRPACKLDSQLVHVDRPGAADRGVLASRDAHDRAGARVRRRGRDRGDRAERAGAARRGARRARRARHPVDPARGRAAPRGHVLRHRRDRRAAAVRGAGRRGRRRLAARPRRPGRREHRRGAPARSTSSTR